MNSHFKAFKGRIINFLSQEKVEYFPNGVIIVNRESGKIVEYGEWNKIKRKYQNQLLLKKKLKKKQLLKLRKRYRKKKMKRKFSLK